MDDARRRALFQLLLAATFFGLMAFSAKLASGRVSGAQTALIRFVVCMLPFVIPRIFRAAVVYQRLDLLFYRGFFGGVAVLLYFTAIEHIPVGTATLLNYTAPIFSGIFAALFIGERLTVRVVVPLVVAMAGVYLVVQAHATPRQIFGFGPWETLGLMSAILSGAAVTAIRVARRTEGSWAIFGSFSLFGLIAALPVAMVRWVWPTPREWLFLLLVGVLSIVAQLLMTHAFRWVETVTAGVISQLAVIISMLLGHIFLGERVTLLSAAGTMLTIGGVVAVMLLTSHPRPSGFDEAPEQ